MSNTSGQKLFARVNSAGYVTDVIGHDLAPPPYPLAEPDPRGNRLLPLYGDVPQHDFVTEVLIGPRYRVEADRVIRSYSVRPKTAAELLQEISWWFGAVHTGGDAAAPRG
jgi:hypothetical protein